MLASTPAPDLRDWGALSTGSIVIPIAFFWHFTRTSATLSRFSVPRGASVLCPWGEIRTNIREHFSKISEKCAFTHNSCVYERCRRVWRAAKPSRRSNATVSEAEGSLGDP